VTAIFPSGTSGGIKRGQAADFYPEGAAWEGAAPIPAVVARVNPDPATDGARVELALRLDSGLPAPLQQGLKGRVEVELERVSPAILVFRSGGLVDQTQGRNNN
jgi:membrane fusion protein (multidrug efflux system)